MGNNYNKNEKEKVSNSALLEYSNGERYIGEVANGMREGYGTYYYQNGEKYEGQWIKNTKNGKFFYIKLIKKIQAEELFFSKTAKYMKASGSLTKKKEQVPTTTSTVNDTMVNGKKIKNTEKE